MKTIRQPQWHKAKWLYHCQTRRLFLDDFRDHDLVLNTKIDKRLLEGVLEAFEVKDDHAEFVGVVFCTRAPFTADQDRYRFLWHGINTRYKMLQSRPLHRSRHSAVGALIFKEKEYWKNKRTKRQAVPADDMDAIAAAFG